MKDEFINQEKEIIDALQAIKDVPERQQAQVERGRAAFLAEAKEISQQPVSISLFQRLINSFTQPKPQMRLSTLTVSIILVSALLVTFSGSVYAARYALPDQPLYPYKLWLEDRRLSITSQTDSQIDLHLAFADERLREYQELGIDLDDPLADQVFENYTHHIEDANELLAASGEHDGHFSEIKDLEDRYQKIFDRDDDEDDDLEPSDDVDEDGFDEDDKDDGDSEDRLEDEEKTEKKSRKETSNKEDKSGESSSDDDAESDSDKSDEPDDEKDDDPDEPDEPDDEKGDEPDDPEKTPDPDKPDEEEDDELNP